MSFLPGDDLPWPEDAIEVGRILGAWGIKGGFRVAPFASDPQALFASHTWFLKPADNARPSAQAAGAAASAAASQVPAVGAKPAARSAAKPAPKPVAVVLPPVLEVTSVRAQGDAVVAMCARVPDRNAAELLRGARVFVSRASFPAPDDDEFYWIDLIGLAVVNQQAQALGTVIGLIETGPHCVLRIAPAGHDAAQPLPPGDELLIPFVDAFVGQVDLPGRTIHVDWALEDASPQDASPEDASPED